MARPLWLRLFGPNGPTTITELRAAIMAAPVGEGIGAGRFFDRIQAILDRPASLPERTAIRDLDQASPDPVLREQPGLAAAVIVEHDLAAAPAPAPAPAPEVVAPAAGSIVAADGPEAAATLADEAGRTASLYLNSVVSNPSNAAGPHSPFAHIDPATPYMLLGDLQTGLVIDTRTKTLLPGGPGDHPAFGAGPNDTVELAGDHSAGFTLETPDYVEQIVAHAGNDYNLIADDANVAAGALLTINAMPLGTANHMLFDGSAETDGRFLFYGSDAGDVFLGGAGNDRIYGLGGADILSGGGGSDTFLYYDATHSSGADYDVLGDFDPAADRIDLDVAVTGFDAAVQGGTLSAGSFSADLAAALAGLGAGRAVLYAPGAGDLAGNLFLIVDANGVAGYQEGEDYVFALAGSTLADLSGQTGFFI